MRSWLDFMRQAGYLSTPEPQPPTPTYVSRPDLRTRGVAGSPALQTRQYAAPPPPNRPQPTPPPTADQIAYQQSVSTPNSYPDPAYWRALNDPAIAAAIAQPLPEPTITTRPTNNYVDPLTGSGRPTMVSDNDPTDLDWAQWIVEWRQMNRDRSSQGLPPIDPESGQPMPDADWNALTPEQQAATYVMLDNVTPSRKAMSGWFHGLPDWVTALEPVVNNPVTRTAADATGQLVEWAGVPQERLYEQEMKAGIQYAATGEMPVWASYLYGDLPGQRFIPSWAPGNAQAADIWFLPNWLEAHPEDRETINQIVAEAEAAGQDPVAAVAAWWQEKQGFIVSLGSQAVADPVNLAGGLGVAGRGLKGFSAFNRARTGGSVVNTAADVAGNVLRGADVAVNAPWTVGKPVVRAATNVVQNTPVYRTLADYLTSPSARAARRMAEAEYQAGIESGSQVNRTIDLSGYADQAPPTPRPPRGPTTLGGPNGPGPLTPEGGGGVSPSTMTDAQLDSTARFLSELGVPGNPDASPVLLRMWDDVNAEIDARAAGTVYRANVPSTAPDIPGNTNLPPMTSNQLPAGSPIQALPPGRVSIFSPPPRRTVADILAEERRVPDPPPEQIIPEMASGGARVTDQAPLEAVPETPPVAQAEVPVVRATTEAEQTIRETLESAPVETPPTPTAASDRAADFRHEDAPPGLLLEGAVPNERSGWSLRYDPERGDNPPLAFFKEQVDNEYPRQAAAINAEIEPYAMEFYEPNYNQGNRIGNDWDRPRMGRTVRPLLEADLMRAYRVAARTQGVPTSGLEWKMNAELAGKPDWDFERLMWRYIFEPDPETALTTVRKGGKPQTVAQVARDKGVISADGVPNSVMNADQARAAKYRYDQATKRRAFVHATDEELDRMIGNVGGEVAPEPVPQPTLDALPTPDDLAARNNHYARSLVDEIEQLPEEYRSAIYAEVGPWATQRYRDIDLMTPMAQMTTDLEYAGRLRVAGFRATGTDLNTLAVANGRVPIDTGMGIEDLATESLDDFAQTYGGRYDALAAERASRGREVVDLDAAAMQGIDTEDFLEQFDIVRRGPFDAEVRAIRDHNRRMRAAGQPTRTLPKGVYLDRIGLPGYVSRDADVIEDAFNALVEAGFPTKRIANHIPAREAQEIVDPSAEMLARAILGSDEAAREARAILHKRRDIAFQSTPPGPTAAGTADGVFQQRGYSTYQNVYAIRAMIRGEQDNALAVADNFGRPLTRADWSIEEVIVDGKTRYQAVNPLTGQRSAPATRRTTEAWVAKFPETADDGSWLTAPECFV